VNGLQVDVKAGDPGNQSAAQTVSLSHGFVEKLPAAIDHIHEVAIVQLCSRSSGGIELDIIMESLGEQIHDHDSIKPIHFQRISNNDALAFSTGEFVNIFALNTV